MLRFVAADTESKKTHLKGGAVFVGVGHSISLNTQSRRFTIEIGAWVHVEQWAKEYFTSCWLCWGVWVRFVVCVELQISSRAFDDTIFKFELSRAGDPTT